MADPQLHDEHDWFRARLDAHALDLLDEDERPRFLEHDRTCERCAEAMKAHRANAPVGGPDSHIPPHIIARWDRASRKLAGLPRQLVREHLEHCDACRQELQALGFASTLAQEPGLEAGEEKPADSEPLAAALPLEPPTRTILIVKRPVPSTRDRWRGWAVGGVAGAALASAAAFLMLPHTNRKSAVTPPPAARIPAAPREPTGRYMMDAIPQATALPSILRGGPGAEATILIGPGQRFVPLSLPDLYLPDSTTLRVTLRDAQGVVRMEERLRYGELSAGRTLLVGDAQAPFAPGSYTLELAPADGGANPPFEFRLRAERAPAP
jgi:hypothetical protein